MTVPDPSVVLAISQTHCATCHAARPSDPDFDEAPGGVHLETVGRSPQVQREDSSAIRPDPGHAIGKSIGND